MWWHGENGLLCHRVWCRAWRSRRVRAQWAANLSWPAAVVWRCYSHSALNTHKQQIYEHCRYLAISHFQLNHGYTVLRVDQENKNYVFVLPTSQGTFSVIQVCVYELWHEETVAFKYFTFLSEFDALVLELVAQSARTVVNAWLHLTDWHLAELQPLWRHTSTSSTIHACTPTETQFTYFIFTLLYYFALFIWQIILVLIRNLFVRKQMEHVKLLLPADVCL